MLERLHADLTKSAISGVKAFDLRYGDLYCRFYICFSRMHADSEVLNRARINPLLRMIRYWNNNERLAQRKTLIMFRG